jgi:hypothetical protein
MDGKGERGASDPGFFVPTKFLWWLPLDNVARQFIISNCESSYDSEER